MENHMAKAEHTAGEEKPRRSTHKKADEGAAAPAAPQAAAEPNTAGTRDGKAKATEEANSPAQDSAEASAPAASSANPQAPASEPSAAANAATSTASAASVTSTSAGALD